MYFERAIAILRARGVDPVVKAEFIAKCLSDGWKWALFTGIDEALPLMQRPRIKVRAMQEGTLFRPYEPVMEIEGRYQDFCVYETALLGLLCQASGVATKAARIKKPAGDRVVMSFGARRPLAKRGKWSGSKRVIACARCGERKVVPNDNFGSDCACGGTFNDLLLPALDRGQQLMEPDTPARVRQKVLERVKGLDL